MAFQIRSTAVLRSVNFLTGFRSAPNPATPAKLFQTCDQPIGRPVGGEFGQFLFAGELFLAFRNLLGGGEGGDGVVVVDGKESSWVDLLSIARLRGGAGGPPTGCEPRVRLPGCFRASRRKATRR